MHILSHLPDYCERYGPLYLSCAYLSENIMGVVKNTTNAGSNVGQEIFNKIMLRKEMISYISNLNSYKNLNLGEQMTIKQKVNLTPAAITKLDFKIVDTNLNQHQKNLIMKTLNLAILEAKCFKKLVLNNIVYRTISVQKNNSHVRNCYVNYMTILGPKIIFNPENICSR